MRSLSSVTLKGGIEQKPLCAFWHNLVHSGTILRKFVHFCRPFFSGLQKGPAERGHVKKRQKVSKSLFDNFRAGQKNVKNRQKYFSTLFARHRFSGPFWGALSFGRKKANKNAQKRVIFAQMHAIPKGPRRNKNSTRGKFTMRSIFSTAG